MVFEPWTSLPAAQSDRRDHGLIFKNFPALAFMGLKQAFMGQKQSLVFKLSIVFLVNVNLKTN